MHMRYPIASPAPWPGRWPSPAHCRQGPSDRDPCRVAHVTRIKGQIDELIQHARRDVEKVDEARAQVLFETTAEVLTGLKKAYEDYERGSERAFRQ